MRGAIGIAATLGIVVALTAPALAPSARAADHPLTITATPRTKKLRLGDDIILDVVIKNPASTAVTLPVLRLASDSISVRVEGESLRAATVTRLHGQFVVNERDDDGANESVGAAGGPKLRFKTDPSRRMLVPAHDELRGEIRFAAVAPGTLRLTTALSMGADEAPLTADPVEVVVATPAGSRRLIVRVETTRAPITIALDGTRAFNSVSQFWSLARSGFYGDLPFWRVVPEQLVQTGDSRGDGTGTSGWYLPAETVTTPLERGVIALARGPHPDSASSQWFITLGDAAAAAERLPGAYAVLGTVIEGLDVADAIAAAELNAATGLPKHPDRVVRVRTSLR